jgi:hypothetical protein
MRIERAIESIHALPAGGWARLENGFKTHGGLELFFTIHKEDRGRGKIGGWSITCQGVREAQIKDFDGVGWRYTDRPTLRRASIWLDELSSDGSATGTGHSWWECSIRRTPMR